jgi:hypothetical protein
MSPHQRCLQPEDTPHYLEKKHFKCNGFAIAMKFELSLVFIQDKRTSSSPYTGG